MANADNKRTRRKALGKGLGALIPSTATAGEKREYFTCAVAKIRPAAEQPRKTFNDATLQELAESISESGLIQPLVVRQTGPEQFELIAGERRWRACQIAGIEDVPVVVKELSNDDAFVVALVENIQREDLNPVEEAMALRRLIDEFSQTQQAIAKRVGKSRSAVANSLRLLNLPMAIRELVTDGQLSAGHARSLVSLSDEEALELADIMVRHGYSVREAEELVRESKRAAEMEEEKPKPEKRVSRYRDDAQIRDVSSRLQEALGTKVTLKDVRGKGRIEIHYDDYEVLQSVIERLIEDE